MYRGGEYLREGMVKEIVYNPSRNTLSADVSGTRNYSLEFYINLVRKTTSLQEVDIRTNLLITHFVSEHSFRYTV